MLIEFRKYMACVTFLGSSDYIYTHVIGRFLFLIQFVCAACEISVDDRIVYVSRDLGFSVVVVVFFMLCEYLDHN